MQETEIFELARLKFKLCPCDFHFNECCFKLVPNLRMCPNEVLFTDVIEKASAKNTSECSSAKIVPVLFIQTEQIEEQVHVFVLGFTDEDRYILIEETKLETHDLKYSLQTYSDAVVRKATKKYKIKIISVIYNYDGDLDQKSSLVDDDYHYLRCKHLSLLLKELLSPENWEYDTELLTENPELLTKHKSELNKINETTSDSRVSLSEMVDLFLKFLLMRCSEVNLNAQKIVLQYLNGFMLACHFLNHQ